MDRLRRRAMPTSTPRAASRMREFPLATGFGFADYLLYVDGKAAGVIEAKKQGATLTGVEVQSGRYAQGLPAACPPGAARCPSSTSPPASRRTSPTALDPEPRARNVFAFHRPETLAEWLSAAAAGHGADAPAVHGRRPSAALRARRPSSPASASCRQLVTEWGDFKLWPAQITAIRNLEASLAQNKPRALIQMATGSGKTFTAISFIYRLIKFAGARRVLFLVDRGNLGRQAKKEFDQYVSPVNNYKFGEEYIVQHLTSNNLDKTARVCISTIQRMYSMLKGRELPEEADEESTERVESAVQGTGAHRLQPRVPDRDLRHHRHRRGAPLHLQPVAPGAGVLRRAPDRPDRHAQQADLRLLQPEPGDGVRPPAGGGRRRERQLRRLPHQDRGHRGRQPRWKPATGCRCWTSPPAPGATGSSTTTSSTRPKSWTAACRRPTRSAPSPARCATTGSATSFRSARSCPRRWSSPRTTTTPRPSSASCARSGAAATSSRRRSPTAPRAASRRS